MVAYTQFLQSYKSVGLASMAAAFNVSNEFLDHEVAELIVAGRINARIDKVGGARGCRWGCGVVGSGTFTPD